jgi:UDP-N-acetylmuramyl-tripeptide synthetase
LEVSAACKCCPGAERPRKSSYYLPSLEGRVIDGGFFFDEVLWGLIRVKLSELIKYINGQIIYGNIDCEITGIAQDSRAVESGDLFICIKGARYDGHQYLKQAAEMGAVAALVEDLPGENYGLTIIRVPVIAEAIKEVAGSFYGYPDRKLKLIGIVGTNGKTTTTYLMKSILEAAGHKVGLIGTIVNLIDDQIVETHNTTPGVLELQKLCAEMVQAGVEYVVMEVSSHSIAQGRITGLTFRCGIFTNITQDHLDYHGTFEEYLRVKTKFFVDLPNTSWAAINIDDTRAGHIVDRTPAKVMTYGIENEALVKAEGIQLSPSGVSYTAITPLAKLKLDLKLTGFFNVYNSLGALTASLSMGIDPEDIKRGLEAVVGVPGRFELVPGAAKFGVIVDYAHTPDGLENILKTGRGLSPHKLLLVFGCGGDRDRTKRPIMGEIAARMADFSIITSDNPRSENPGQIIKEIEVGFHHHHPSAQYLIEVDRATAINKVIAMAEPGDLVLIAGKGHETYQDFGDHRIHFDDREVASKALKEKNNG